MDIPRIKSVSISPAKKHPSLSSDERLVFERLLSEITIRCTNLPSDDVAPAISDALREVAEFLKTDRCVVYEYFNDADVFHPTLHGYPKEDHQLMQELNDWTWSSYPYIYESLSYIADLWKKNRTVQVRHLEDLPEEAAQFKKLYQKFRVKSFMSFPIFMGGTVAGAMSVSSKSKHQMWPEEVVPRLQMLGGVFLREMARKHTEEIRRNAFYRIKEAVDLAEADCQYLQEEIKQDHNFGEIIGQGRKLKKVLAMVSEVSPTDATVLILGETGTGKELVARAIHEASKRKERPLIRVNCATLPSNLIESELFGHEKGAFTGAISQKIGRFELANRTTLFLDEIGELPVELQPKLLRVLQDGEFERLGGGETRTSDVRIIAATNRNLEKAVEEGRFRRDLWFRLNVYPISVPPLRDRMEDIPLLVDWFLEKYNKKMGKRITVVSRETLGALKRYSWPGNVRELENLVERAVITSKGDTLVVDMPNCSGSVLHTDKTLESIEREHILQILKDCSWKIEGVDGAASVLGLAPSTLRSRMQKLKIRRPGIN